jgi:hypothetical protein
MTAGTANQASSMLSGMSRGARTIGADNPASEIAGILREDGCVIVADAVAPDYMDQVLDELKPHMENTKGGSFEFLGHSTRRTGALIARSESVRALITHPAVLDTLDLTLADHGATYQIDLTQVVDVGPGQAGQAIHRDQWAFDHFPFPAGFEAEIGTMWAATDFTEEMGATRVVVGSHLWEEEPSNVDPSQTTAAVMSKGSVLLYTGSLFHGAGPNRSDRRRVGINIGYSLGWLRQEENQFLACPPEIARTLPEGLLRLMGYQWGAFAIGYVDALRDPLAWLYGLPSVPPDFLAYRREARKAHRRTGVYPRAQD